MQLGFFIDQSRCIGCNTCVVACKDWHDIAAGQVNWRWVTMVEKGSYPEVFVAFLSLSCMHCAEPLCMTVCPVDAIGKRESDGIVEVDQDTCLGKDACGLCKEACPWGVPQFGPERDAKMQKCHFCVDQWEEGIKPICVEACPVWALDAGPLDELKGTYGVLTEIDGFVYDEISIPSVIFKARKPELLNSPASSG
jgi:anaerobic dimethyl sulfoxide reductase subunit B (iron-sulfur subunit)